MSETKASAASAATQRVESKIPVAVVVVHGIGDQVRNATVQQVVAQFSRHYRHEEPVPLGAFDPGPVRRKFQTSDTEVRRFDFSEVYWADIPREVAEKGYTLEETKAWASVIVERMERQEKMRAGKPSGVNFPLVQQVVGEMVETIGVLERLTFLAEKAGIAKFDLNKVLVNYLDDVQLVAEFQAQRDKILAKFKQALDDVDKDAEIYIVAHSEGTVVSFLGLLEAMWDPKALDPAEFPKGSPWLPRVRGYLTIGSPIDKHLVLWPELFEKWIEIDRPPSPRDPNPPKFNPPKPDPAKPGDKDRRIKWRNYHDHGDPVGFELDYARKWLHDRNVPVTAFEFEGQEEQVTDLRTKKKPDPGHDIGFARYYLPGKAHNDYWTDPAVFDHFIESVLKKNKTPPKNPANKKWVWPVAYLASYALPLLLLIAAVFFVIRSVTSFRAEAQLEVVTVKKAMGEVTPAGVSEAKIDLAALKAGTPDSGALICDAMAIACLLAGVTVLSRMPRLANPHLSPKWTFIALGIFVVFAVGFWNGTSDPSIQAMGQLPAVIIKWADPQWNSEDHLLVLKSCLVGLGFLIAIGSAWAGRKFVGSARGRFSCGSKPLILLGGITAVAMVLILLKTEGSNEPSLWPVLLALGGFLYLWWLAILLFDLVFVWHRYIRHEVANQRMEHACEAT